MLGASRLMVQTLARGGVCLTLSGCMTLVPQLEPTDFASVEQVSARRERDQLRSDNTINRHYEPQGTRYTKGSDPGAPRRSWQSLDAILRSDENSSAALPAKQLRRSRVFTALAVASSILFVAGIATTARDGFSFRDPSPGNAVLLGGALGSVAFAVVAGVLFRRARTGYDRAVDIYNDSLGVRLGVMTPDGSYIPPPEVEVDAQGFVITEDRLPPGSQGPRPVLQPAPTLPAPVFQPAPTQPAPTQPAPTLPAPVLQPAPVVPTSETQPVPPPPASAPHARRTTPDQAPPRLATPLLAASRPVRPVGALTLLPQR